jgi:hypothetical protein
MWLLFLGSCSLFEVRDVEEPDTGGSIFQQPDRPEIVLVNLQNAVANLNTQNYLRGLHENDFEFVASQQAQTDDPALWPSWGRDSEQLYFNNMQSAAQAFSGHQLQLNNEIQENISATATRITVDYVLTVVHNRSSSGLPTVCTGQMIVMVEADDNGLWYIMQWTDTGNDTDFTWSQLKAAFFRG